MKLRRDTNNVYYLRKKLEEDELEIRRKIGTESYQIGTAHYQIVVDNNLFFISINKWKIIEILDDSFAGFRYLLQCSNGDKCYLGAKYICTNIEKAKNEIIRKLNELIINE